MSLDRTVFNTWVDDDVSNTTGTLIDKAAIDTGILDPVDAVLGAIDDAGALSPAAAVELTIATDAVTLTAGKNVFSVDTQSDAATDDLSTISLDAAGRACRIVILKAENVARVVTVKHNVGNIQLTDGDCVLSGANDRLTLIRDGSTWYEIGRSGASSGTTTVALSSSGGGSATYTAQSCRWSRAGKIVICHITVTINADSLTAGNLSLTGLPFTSAASDAGGGHAVVISVAFTTSLLSIRAVVDDSATTAALYRVTATATTQATRLTASDIQGSSSFEMTLVYSAA